MLGTAQQFGKRLNASALAGLGALLSASNGALSADAIAVCACLYDRSILSHDPGAFDRMQVWRHLADSQFYPASICKMAYLAALAAFETQGKIALNDEDHRAIKAMIGISSNEATAFLLGRLCDAHDGPNLRPAELEAWCEARYSVQAWLESLSLPAWQGSQLLHATYEDSPYGRAYQARAIRPGNTLSAEATAVLLHEMLRGALPQRDWMAAHLSRDWQRGGGPNAEGDQVKGFLTEGIPADFRVWSKAGHTSTTRHDVVYAEAPDGRGMMLCVMTEGRWSADHDHHLPAFARAFVASAFD